MLNVTFSYHITLKILYLLDRMAVENKTIYGYSFNGYFNVYSFMDIIILNM